MLLRAIFHSYIPLKEAGVQAFFQIVSLASKNRSKQVTFCVRDLDPFLESVTNAVVDLLGSELAISSSGETGKPSRVQSLVGKACKLLFTLGIASNQAMV